MTCGFGKAFDFCLGFGIVSAHGDHLEIMFDVELIDALHVFAEGTVSHGASHQEEGGERFIQTKLPACVCFGNGLCEFRIDGNTEGENLVIPEAFAPCLGQKEEIGNHNIFVVGAFLPEWVEGEIGENADGAA